MTIPVSANFPLILRARATQTGHRDVEQRKIKAAPLNLPQLFLAGPNFFYDKSTPGQSHSNYFGQRKFLFINGPNMCYRNGRLQRAESPVERYIGVGLI